MAMTATKKKRAPQPTQGQIAMLYEVQRGMPYVPKMGQRKRCWESMLGLWVQVQDGRPGLTLAGTTLLQRRGRL